jgi:hypothetical protein
VSNDKQFRLIQPGCFDDQLTEILRQGARPLLARAVAANVADYLPKHVDLKTGDGRQHVVRHGHLLEREVMIRIGPVAVRRPRVRGREAAAGTPGRVRVTPAILEVDRDATADPLLETLRRHQPAHCGKQPTLLAATAAVLRLHLLLDHLTSRSTMPPHRMWSLFAASRLNICTHSPNPPDPRGESICTVAVNPAANRTPSGTLSM